MFGLGYPELFVIGLVALVVIGPRRLPGLMRQAGRFSAQLRRTANEFRHELEMAAERDQAPHADEGAGERPATLGEAPRVAPDDVPPGADR